MSVGSESVERKAWSLSRLRVRQALKKSVSRLASGTVWRGVQWGRLVKENVNASIVCKDLLIAEVAIRQGCWSKMPPEQRKNGRLEFEVYECRGGGRPHD